MLPRCSDAAGQISPPPAQPSITPLIHIYANLRIRKAQGGWVRTQSLRENLRCLIEHASLAVGLRQIHREGFVERSGAKETDDCCVIVVGEKHLTESSERLRGPGINPEHSFVFSPGHIPELQFLECCSQEKVRLYDFRPALNRTLERSNGSLRIASRIERNSEEIGQFSGSRFEQETGAEGFGGARILVARSKPLAQFGIRSSVRVGLNAEFEKLRADA